jgi:hypothetical protein
MKLLILLFERFKTSKRTAPDVVKKDAVDEQQKCVYGAKNAGQTVVKISSSAILVEEQEQDQGQDQEQTDTL